jgi:hypothetical protein
MSDMFVAKVAYAGRTIKMADSWSTSANQPKSDLWSTVSQSIADDIDKELLEGLINADIRVYFRQTPKKGDLVRYGDDYASYGFPHPLSGHYHGLCVEAYDPENEVAGKILFEDGNILNFRPAEGTKFSWLEVIDE